MRDSNGALWDSGGIPDPYIYLVVDTQTRQTGYFSDTTEGIFATPPKFTVTVSSSSSIKIQVWDDDWGADNLIDSMIVGNPIALVRGGGFDGPLYAGSTSSIGVSIRALP